ncbi:hypothetical protein [Sphingobium sp. GW456-12-10-14-TSB1]|uniref:hypothetical protein n=1 Tax=Sphingobium sp. GW456-12-10-14-TSB1 TaxID=1987165 RepID=UPI0020CC1C27|nr:hypothetical protein [Sphingobium sp. GW456-12-10-14-TSB1]
MIAGLKAAYRGADFIDNPDTFMAEHPARFAGRDITLENVQVGAADRRLGDADNRVGGGLKNRPGALVQAFLTRAVIY